MSRGGGKRRAPEPLDTARSWGHARWVWVAALTLLVSVLSLHPMSNNDIWLHLKTGEIILQEGAVPTTERFSFTVPGRPVVPHEWLAAVAFVLAHRAGGVPGLILLRLLLAVGTTAMLVLAARGMGARLPVLTFPLALALVLASARMLVRPHLWSFLLAAVFLWLLDRHRRRGGASLWALVPLQALWANLHGGFVLGWLLTGSYLVAELAALPGRARATVLGGRRLRRLALVAAALPVACLANPAGHHLLLFPFRITRVETFMEMIYEWQSPFSPGYRGSFLFVEYLGMVGIATVALLLPLPGKARTVGIAGGALAAVGIAAGWPGGPALGLAVFVIAVGMGRGAPPLAHALAVAALFYLSARMNRSVTDFALLAAGPAAAALDRRMRRTASPGAARMLRRAGATLAGGAFLAAVALAIALGGYWYGPGSRRDRGLGAGSAVPVRAADFLEQHGIGGRMFCDYAAASYMIWRLHPGVQVFFDSRNEVYGEEIAREFHRAKQDGPSLTRTLDTHRVDLAVLRLGAGPGAAAVRELEQRDDFALVWLGDRLGIWARRTPANRDRLEPLTYRVLSPLFSGAGSVGTPEAPDLAREAERALGDCDDCLLPRLALAEAAFLQQQVGPAEARFTELAAERPDLYPVWLRLGDLRALQGRTDGALAAYREALRILPGDPAILRRLEFLRSTP